MSNVNLTLDCVEKNKTKDLQPPKTPAKTAWWYAASGSVSQQLAHGILRG